MKGPRLYRHEDVYPSSGSQVQAQMPVAKIASNAGSIDLEPATSSFVVELTPADVKEIEDAASHFHGMLL